MSYPHNNFYLYLLLKDFFESIFYSFRWNILVRQKRKELPNYNKYNLIENSLESKWR